MDQTVIDKLQELRKKHLSALTFADKEFIRARQSYLGKRDKVKYSAILKRGETAPKVKGVSKKEMKRLAHPAAL